ncbi:DUF3362 domain-containing protein [Candidatus Woesearchaeota archaeon]|nr:DUF3362 domain-containing protein [Candidatus Woesearchaeota archaeon]
MKFLPISLQEGKKYYNNFKQFDVIFITGDPYYDHPLSGIAILSRLLDSKGFKVGIIAQPIKDEDYQVCGTPKYFFCITSGFLDSMLANYTPMLKKRENVLVPERALMVYTQKIKSFFKKTTTILGGLEATIRRFTHFDYRTNALRHNIIDDTKADILIFGNAERALLNILNELKNMRIDPTKKVFEQIPKEKLNLIDGIAFRTQKPIEGLEIPSYEDCTKDKNNFNKLTRITTLNPESALIEKTDLSFIQHNKSLNYLTEDEMNCLYEFPYEREFHPNSKNLNDLKSITQKLKNSVVIGRGCFGSCNFCVIPLVQGKQMSSRTRKSILNEIKSIYEKDRIISDLTLPTVNMYNCKCKLYNVENKLYSPILEKEITIFTKTEKCNQNCIGCKFRIINNEFLYLLKDIEKIKKDNILELRSAIRHDIIQEQPHLLGEIMKYTTRLKIAPEHISQNVLRAMNKSNPKAFISFLKEYSKYNKPLVPYFVAAHPGCTTQDMEELKEFCNKNNLTVNLTQIFTPTPGTVSTCMYYTEVNPLTNEKVYIPRTFREKKDQKNILFEDENYNDYNA